jgi:DNA helicase MCM9
MDEFSMIRPEERASIHEAMEQQTISVAKAGIVCKINTRTTIIAASNPTNKNQKWDPNLDLLGNTGIQTSLLSRFDLVFVMCDVLDAQEDSLKAEHCLRGHCAFDDPRQKKKRSSLWSLGKLRRYLAFVQKIFEPTVSHNA